MGRKQTNKQKNEVKNNPWGRSYNSEVVHLIVINGWETHRELEYEKKKKKKIMLDIFLCSTCRLNELFCILVNLHYLLLVSRS